MKKNKSFVASTVAAIFLLLVPCLAFSQTAIKVGNILPLSGPSAHLRPQ